MSVYIHPTAEVSDEAHIGDGTKIWNQVHIRENVDIGKNCNIGKDVYIDDTVKIGNSCKIQNFVSVYKGVTIEDHVFIGAGTIFTNDKHPRAFTDEWPIVPTLVKKGATLGANSTVICGSTIGSYAMIGAGSVVTKDVPDHGLIYGNPARLHGFICKCGKETNIKSEEDDRVVLFCSECGEEIIVMAKNCRNIKR